MKFRNEIIDKILDKEWKILIEEHGGGSYQYSIYFERYLNQIIIKDCNSHSIYDFAEMDSLVITKIDDEKIVLSGKKLGNEYFDEWILLEIEEEIIENEDDNWPDAFLIKDKLINNMTI